MSTVFLVRHAQASFATENYDRVSDLGRQQSRWLGEYFAARGLAFRRVLAGTLVRQRDTARDIVEAMGRDAGTIETHAGLDEYPGEALYHAYTGGRDPRAHQVSDYRDYWRTFRAAMAAWAADELTGVPESWGAFGARVHEALQAAVKEAGRDEAILVVSSGGAIGRAVADVVDSPAKVAIELNLQFRNSAFCELIAGAGALRLLSFNAIPHLEAPERRRAITWA
jgi:broad specificity phosphatase PhoE